MNQKTEEQTDKVADAVARALARDLTDNTARVEREIDELEARYTALAKKYGIEFTPYRK